MAAGSLTALSGRAGLGPVTEVESDIIGSEDSRVAFTRALDGELVGVRDANGARYVVADHQRTVNAVLFSDGTLSGSASYDPYGQERGSSGDTVPFGYAGGHHDSHTGLVKFGARYSNPAIGTFTQMDPAGQEQNPYLYAAGDPINNTDPTGLLTATEVTLGLGAAALVAGGLSVFGAGALAYGATVVGWQLGAAGFATGVGCYLGNNCDE